MLRVSLANCQHTLLPASKATNVETITAHRQSLEGMEEVFNINVWGFTVKA